MASLVNAADPEKPLLGGPASERESDSAAAQLSVYAMPATQGQVRFWSLDQLEPGHPGLNMPLMWQFTGPLDTAALQTAFNACSERHEMLRTTFDLVDGRLSQIIHPSVAVDLPLVDLSSLSGEAQRATADSLTKQHAAIPMDLKRGPLLLLRLLRFNANRHLLLLTMHHIICDGISLGVLMRDMLAFYAGEVLSSTVQLPELPIQFGDYAVWQEEWRRSEEAEASRMFWHETLGKKFSTVSLPQDTGRRSSETRGDSEQLISGEIETLLIPRDLAARAHAFCLRENVTFNMLLFSVFVAMIARVTGKLEFTVGSPCANRTEDTEELIGLFMNIQIFPARLEDLSTFRDLLQQVRTWTLGAYENQTLPFEDLVHDPFFAEGASSFQVPVFFLYQKSFMLAQRIGALEVVPLRSESPGAVFDMMFAIVDREEEGPRLQLEFDPQKYAAATIQRWLRLYVNLLDSGITQADEPVQRLPALSAAERHMLLVQANDTATDFGPFCSIPAQFTTQAQRFPERVALVCKGREWTYAQLLEYVERLAERLVAEGVQPGDLVAVAVHRSMEMVGAVLAVLSAGAAYVPLDPRHPRERVEAVLADCEPKLLLESTPLKLKTAARVINVLEPIGSIPPQRTATPLSPDSLAYVIYTSGTTGTPKGVAIEHRAILNLLHAVQDKPGIDAKDVLVAVTTLSFDIAALEIFLPLLVGARLVIATEEQVHEPAALLRLLKSSEATVMQATPGAWHALVDAGWNGDLPLKVLCGGEALSRPLADKLLERSSKVWNMYGPTETTVWSSATRVTAGVNKPRIGPPLANTQFYNLDDRQQPLPVGFQGELYIGGIGLAQGYWNKLELTEERFVPNPFGSGRLYKTGDLARWHPDRTLELLGRSDFQVKCSGYRIELGDIETSLLKHPDVREAVVVQHRTEDTLTAGGTCDLTAYVGAGERGSSASGLTLVRELKEQLLHSLPEYMIPNQIVALAQLPRNTNGKIDRSGLRSYRNEPADRSSRGQDAETQKFVPPRDVFERQLTEIWQTSLGIPRISIRASFFSLGVSSLAALRLVTKMNRIYGTDLGLATLLSAPSIESIAELIRKRFSPNTESPVVAIKPTGRKPPLFMIHGVGGNVISFHGLAMRLGSDQPVYGIQAQSLLSGKPALLRLEDMASEYIRAMRVVQPQGPYHFLGYSFGGTVAMEMAHQLQAAGEQVALLSMLDSKSLVYWQELARNADVNTRVNQRVERLRGNTSHLEWKDRVQYIMGKLLTRGARWTYRLASTAGIRSVPSFMKSTDDLNRVAVNRYRLKPYNGHVTLFRASEQHDGIGPHDLGWSGLFTEGVTVCEIAGDHERVFLEPMVEKLATLIRDSLNQVQVYERVS